MSRSPLALCYALREEIKPFFKECRVQTEHHFKPTVISRAEFCGVPLFLCQTGLGMNPAHEGTEHLIDQFHPSLIISVGYAGGTQPSLKTGDLVLASAILSETRDRFEPDEGSRSLLEKIIREEQIPYQVGPLLSRWEVADKEEKAGLAKKGVAAVDIETAAIAAVALNKETPLVSLRAIFDTLDEELPFGNANEEETRSLDLVFKNPKSILGLPKFYRMSHVCQGNLSKVLRRFVNLS